MIAVAYQRTYTIHFGDLLTGMFSLEHLLGIWDVTEN
jgi:hypothetical protein